MRYACLVYLDEAKLDALTDPERDRLRRDFVSCEDDLRRSGHLLAAEALESVRAATTLRIRDGRAVMLDGPAAPAEEQLARVLVVEARDLNEALRLAAGHPSSGLGSVEIRPVRQARGARVGRRAGHGRGNAHPEDG